jgi:hypothetical protein
MVSERIFEKKIIATNIAEKSFAEFTSYVSGKMTNQSSLVKKLETTKVTFVYALFKMNTKIV